jgi:hypothetical protein
MISLPARSAAGGRGARAAAAAWNAVDAAQAGASGALGGLSSLERFCGLGQLTESSHTALVTLLPRTRPQSSESDAIFRRGPSPGEYEFWRIAGKPWTYSAGKSAAARSSAPLRTSQSGRPSRPPWCSNKIRTWNLFGNGERWCRRRLKSNNAADCIVCKWSASAPRLIVDLRSHHMMANSWRMPVVRPERADADDPIRTQFTVGTAVGLSS